MKKPTTRNRFWLRATALAALAPVMALAQTNVGDPVTIYGFVKADVEHVRASGGGAPSLSVNRLSNNLSVLGFRMKEDLGAGLGVWAQIETNVRMDNGDGPWGGRNTAIGLSSSSAGQIVMGQWEAPLRFVSVYAIDPFTAGIFASNSIMGNGFATGANGVSPTSFDRRQPNLLQYWSPNLANFEFRLAYAMPEEKTEDKSPSMWGGLVIYRNGPLYAAWGYEQHRSYFYNGSKDDAHRIGVAYSFGPTRVRGSFERLSYEPERGQSLTRNAWQLAVSHQFTPQHEVMASYVRAQSPHGNTKKSVGGIGIPGTDAGANQVSLGYTYHMSKRTDLWTAYTRITNGATSNYNLSANSIGGMKPGQDPSGFGVGITHKF
ncbi:porin (plasmid) [Diaphorobacter sp. HDW4B]|uniref:porin n=1 Tax=Diaphorobacter sp. HDW4B TaxID=2714925 RepID=UPI00140E1BB3|nr:porin [Diaphorobacter sp. HDW4B]QIL73848.1 porin [Diaphorobacter sp. HDW4B]